MTEFIHQILGLTSNSTLEETKKAYSQYTSNLEQKISEAPTPSLKEKLKKQLQETQSAYSKFHDNESETPASSAMPNHGTSQISSPKRDDKDSTTSRNKQTKSNTNLHIGVLAGAALLLIGLYYINDFMENDKRQKHAQQFLDDTSRRIDSGIIDIRELFNDECNKGTFVEVKGSTRLSDRIEIGVAFTPPPYGKCPPKVESNDGGPDTVCFDELPRGIGSGYAIITIRQHSKYCRLVRE